jgi:hypothetical protein
MSMIVFGRAIATTPRWQIRTALDKIGINPHKAIALPNLRAA